MATCQGGCHLFDGELLQPVEGSTHMKPENKLARAAQGHRPVEVLPVDLVTVPSFRGTEVVGDLQTSLAHVTTNSHFTVKTVCSASGFLITYNPGYSLSCESYDLYSLVNAYPGLDPYGSDTALNALWRQARFYSTKYTNFM